MPIARRLLVPEGVSRCYHCVSRCVRRAFLCDGDGAHRKDWIKHRLLELNQVFAIEIGGFAILANHLHLMVRTQPDWVVRWSRAARPTREPGSNDHGLPFAHMNCASPVVARDGAPASGR
jgi:hypothetical protein